MVDLVDLVVMEEVQQVQQVVLFRVAWAEPEEQGE
jgi:hypothetical protein